MVNTCKIFLRELLPYSPESKVNKHVRSGLKEYQSLLTALHEANEALYSRDLKKFDALVGENACEIRAIWLTTTYIEETPNLAAHIRECIHKIDLLLEPKKLTALMSSGKTLDTILHNENLDIELSKEKMFAIQCYLLCIMKDVKPQSTHLTSIYRIEACDPRLFQRFGDITSCFTRELLDKLRSSLSHASVQFVREKAATSQDLSLMEMVSEKATVIKRNLPCVPMFWTYKSLLPALKSNKVPLLIHMKFLDATNKGYLLLDEEFLLFSVRNGTYKPSELSNIDTKKSVCVFQGLLTPNSDGKLMTRDEWKQQMLSRSITDVILAGAADHRQYPDALLDSQFETEPEYSHYKHIAQEQGFCDENPTTFFIQHVYAARLDTVLNTIN